MKQKLCALAALILALSLLCGCANADLSWFTDRFKTGSQTAASDDGPSGDEEEQTTTAIVTELPTEISAFGLSYQEDYGLHPYNCESLNNRSIFSFIYEPLFAVTEDYRAEPVLVDHWETENDGFKTVIHLKSGILFHDGTPLTAQDAVWSILSARDSAYYGKRLYHVTTAEVADDTTFVILTSCAYECLPLLLDMPVTKMPPPAPEEPEEADAEAAKDAAPAEAAEEAAPAPYVPPVGTGPYYLDGTERLVRWARWWQHKKPLVDFDEISLCHTTTTANIRDNFEYQNINLVLTDPNSAAYAGFHNDNELWEYPTPIMQYIGYNLTSSVFSNYGLRSAITYAIDRDTIVANDLDGFATASVLPCLPQSQFYDTRLAVDYGYDLEKCKSHLAEADIRDMDEDGILDVYVPSLGYALPVSGTMIVCSTSMSRVQTANDLVTALNRLGFDITLRTLDEADYRYALNEGVYDLYFGEVRLSPNFDLSPFFSPSGTLNYGAMADATMINLCDLMLVNGGNSYNLYQRVCERGYLTPVLFKSYALYTTRGSVSAPNGYWDWFLPKNE